MLIPRTSRRPLVTRQAIAQQSAERACCPPGDGDGNGDDPATLANLEVSCVDPQEGPVPLDQPGEGGVDPFVELLAQPADLALLDAGPTHRLDQILPFRLHLPDAPAGQSIARVDTPWT